MKLEFDISDITREDLVNAMAERLLTTYVREEETNSTYPTNSPLADQMRKLIEQKVSEIAESHVRADIDNEIQERIALAVDAVLAEGWQATNTYGEPRGPKVDLRGRVSEVLLTATRDYSGSPMTPIERQVKAAVDNLISKEFAKEIEAARKSLREQLDTAVSAKFTETLKTALGIR